ncbi:MAG: isocitrate dehydrogenase, partial [Gemmatimonadetes bacterium]|nr:isocitrate dehydrogenase [Gemmatimonadota bacterium]
GVHTIDLARGKPAVGTAQFADAIIANLGKRSEKWLVRTGSPLVFPPAVTPAARVVARSRSVIGCDVFVEADTDAETLGPKVRAAVGGAPLKLVLVDNRGTQVYPSTGGARTDAVDVWRCRVVREDGGSMDDATIVALLGRLTQVAPWMHIEKLQVFDGVDGFTKAQGQQ